MASEKFDFEAFKGTKIPQYLKEYCKPMMVKKATCGIVMTDYKMNGKKTDAVFIPFKKPKEATELFKQIKADKEHLLKKVGLVTVAVEGDTIKMQVKKGGLSDDMLQAKAAPFFLSKLKMNLQTAESAAPADKAAVADKKAANTEKPTAEKTAPKTAEQPAEKPIPKMTPERRAKMKANLESIQSQIDKVKKALKIG